MLHRTLVRRLHDARPAAGDNGQIMLGQTLRDVLCGAIIWLAGFGPGGTENRHRRAGLRKGLKRIHELGHDAEDAPRIFADEVVVAHGRNIMALTEGTSAGTEMKRAGESKSSGPLRVRFLKNNRGFRRSSNICSRHRCARRRGRRSGTSERRPWF